MGIWELILIAIGLAMDAFAVSICQGLSLRKVTLKKALLVGLYFGSFQALMPLLGYLIGAQFADMIVSIDHWIAFALLLFIGVRMVIGSFKNEGCPDRSCPNENCTDRECPNGNRPQEATLEIREMLPLAIATSIDALAVGVTFAFIQVRIIPAISFIGIITFLLSVIGVKIGNIFGTRYKSKAELAGGIILILMGLKILLEHLGLLPF